MNQPKLIVVYACTHELPDTDMTVERAKTTPYEFPPSLFTKIKRKLSGGITIRRPCMDDCPVCLAKKRVFDKQKSMVTIHKSTPSQTFSPQTAKGMFSTPTLVSASASDSPLKTPPQPYNLSEGPPSFPVLDALAAGWDAKTRREEINPRGRARSDPMKGLSPMPPPPSHNESSLHARVHKWTSEQTHRALKEHSEGYVSFNRFSDITEEGESPVDPALKRSQDKKKEKDE
ncbi:17a95b16-5bbf-470c-852b-42ddb04802ab [Sclerotinia trifoliorum]|uniref:17a95b16-5bbf-470c-852b-42ddb04802ab n=1 Tax=Sclerotinia trifoliorum TaxID=28548 RepID=A0A8H2ZSD4_9HELO|nr:17a95b16-5bbf-470c-852b-42ddb04802ab [Sclerotinia trifoliorum]